MLLFTRSFALMIFRPNNYFIEEKKCPFTFLNTIVRVGDMIFYNSDNFGTLELIITTLSFVSYRFQQISFSHLSFMKVQNIFISSAASFTSVKM